jgi:hypothetical protein
VDPDRIGCIGHSLGGHNGLFTAALDQRIRIAVTSCGFTGLPEYYGGDLTGWTSDRYMPRIRDEYGKDPLRMPWDFDEILAAISPRPVFISAPLFDENFAVMGVRRVVDRVSEAYTWLQAADRLQVVYPATAHDFPPAVREQAYQWIARHLGNR